MKSKITFIFILAAIVAGRTAPAQEPRPEGTPPPEPPKAEEPKQEDEAHSGGLEWSGYVTASYERFDFYRNAQDDDPARRARTDLERVVLEVEKDWDKAIGFSVEIEFEHGGTGAAVEFEGDEFGEFEQEVEHGGEIVIEHAYLRLGGTPKIAARIGHLLVPFGMVNTHHAPTDYFTLRRSLAETKLLPNVWHETGVEAFGRLGAFSYQLQVVDGLDSAGFNSQDWIAGGNKRRLEFSFANDLALVARLDWHGLKHALLGGSVYSGKTAGNRPLPNLDVGAPLLMLEGHGRYERGPFAFRTGYVWGRLENADDVTRANLQAFNPGALGIDRTPVGSEAFAFFAEAGYDVLSLWHKKARLDVFGRYDAYDTMHAVEGDVLDNPRYDVRAWTAGINYRPRPFVVLKGEYSHRRNGGSIAPETSVAGLGLGFEF